MPPPSLLFQKTYDLVKWLYPTVNSFPRKQRLILSQRIEVTAIRILELAIDYSDNSSESSRQKILHETQKLQILLRVCKDLSYLSFRKYEHGSSLLKGISDEVSNVGGGAMACADLYAELCSFRNLELAYRKARKGKRSKKAVMDFEFSLEENLFKLKHELETLTYKPCPLKQFTIRDPKTRVISASHFRDRVVHHALCNIIQPIFERMFINDSYANRIGKGTSKALERFDSFKRRVFGNGRLINNARDNNMVIGYVLKADIRHYFDTVDHEILMGIIGRKVKDERTLVLIRKILNNHTATITGKGMPIGNLTSQFFANLYLNELDYFVKHGLKAKFYVRYVDDFVIMHPSIETLFTWRQQIACFLESLKLELHPEKSKIYPLHKGVNFLGYRIFYHYILLKKSNIRRMESRMREYERLYSREEITYEKVLQGFESWKSYARYANSYKVRKEFAKKLNSSFITM